MQKAMCRLSDRGGCSGGFRALRRSATTIGIAALALSLASGCGSTSKVVLHTFEIPPTSWVELTTARAGHGGRLDAPLSVRNHHLQLSGSRALLETAAFEQLRGSVDLAIVGGDPDGIAGVFLWQNGAAKLLCLALRPRGEGQSRFYRGAVPFVPTGGAGWKRRLGGATGFARIGFAVQGGKAEFRIDGKVVGSRSVSSAATAGSGPAVWQVGVFSHGVKSRWNSFIVADPRDAGSRDGRAYSPEQYVDWGDAGTADRLVAEFAGASRRFANDPSRPGVFAIAAPLEAALNICRANGDTTRLAKIQSQANDVAAKLRSAARRIGEDELWISAFRDTAKSGGDREKLLGAEGADFAKKAADARAQKRFAEALVWAAAALEVRSTPEGLRGFEDLSRRVPALGFAFRFDESKKRKKILDEAKFREILTGKYGGLSRRDDGIVVDLTVKRSDIASEVEKATRRVTVSAEGMGMSEEERKELERLESSRAEDLREAIAGAQAIRASAQVLGRSAVEDLQDYEFDGKTYELHINEGKRLRKDFARYRALKSRWDSLAGKTRIEEIDAERTTLSMWFRAGLDVSFRGKKIVSGEELSEYFGIELWKHAADPAKRIEASRPTKGDLREALDIVRARALRRFDRLTSKHHLITKLSADERVAFFVQIARGTGSNADQISLRWLLQEEFGLSSVLRDRVARRLLK